MKISGIYKIINKVNSKYYVGSSNNIHKRWKYHTEDLIRGNHHSPHLQRSWNKYGKNNFNFVIVDPNVVEENLLIEEQKHLDQLKKNTYYNTSLIAGKVEMTNEVRQKIRDKLMGNKNGIGHVVTDEMKRKISEAQIGKLCPQKGNGKRGKPFSDEHKGKLKEARKHQICSEVTRQKFRERMTGSNNPNFGKRFTNEHRKKLSDAAKNRNKLGVAELPLEVYHPFLWTT